MSVPGLALLVENDDGEGLVELFSRFGSNELTESLRRLLRSQTLPQMGRTLHLCELAEQLARLRQTTEIRLGLLGARAEALDQMTKQCEVATLVVKREVSKLIEPLPAPRGPVAKGEEEPVIRGVTRDLGIDAKEVSAYRKIGAIEDDKWDEYLSRVEHGEKVPRTTEALARTIERTGWTSNDCYTPAEWVDAGRLIVNRTLGRPEGEPFDCDPQSCLAAQAGIVRARNWYSLDEGQPRAGEREGNLMGPMGFTVEDLAEAEGAWAGTDGLRAEATWGRGWWCNPGYDAETVKATHARVRAERAAGSVGVLLINADLSKADQLELLDSGCTAFPRGRISFWSPAGELMRGNRFSQVIFGINVEPDAWRSVLNERAVCTRAWL